MSSIITLEEVSKTYRVGEVDIHALHEVSLEIEEGEFIVILGPSGSGKTTLLNVIGGLDEPTSGEVEVGGEKLNGMQRQQLTQFRKKHIGFIFQFFNLIPTLTAYENIALSSDLTEDNDLSPEDVLEAVGLQDRADHFPSQLSGGEQQRVAIARALAKNTPVMLCDEPTGELDYETGIKILSLLRDINREYKKTFLVVTHNSAIGQMADRVVKLRSGDISDDYHNQQITDPSQLEW